jgi:VIT1/CCC1 family predicted Fe2+/Mn2+ transporter
VQSCRDPHEAARLIAAELPPKVAESLHPGDYERIQAHLTREPAPASRLRLTSEDWRGALAVFLLVFLSTLPVVLPFAFIHNAHLALRTSNGIAIAMLYGAGHLLAGYAGFPKFTTGFIMVALGGALVALTIALGG